MEGARGGVTMWGGGGHEVACAEPLLSGERKRSGKGPGQSRARESS